MSENLLTAIIGLIGSVLCGLIGAFGAMAAVESKGETGVTTVRRLGIIGLFASMSAAVGLVLGLAFAPAIVQRLGVTLSQPPPVEKPLPTAIAAPIIQPTYTPYPTYTPFPTLNAVQPTSASPPTARTSTPVSQESPTVVPTKCLSMHLGAGKQFIVTIYNGCYYHFNIACAGCKAGEENNYVIYYAGSTTKVTVPEGSVWQYNSEPNQGEVCSDLIDHWPSNLPSFLNFAGVQQLWPCGIR